MNLEILAVVRAQEQLDAGAWKRPGWDEGGGPRICVVPRCEHSLAPDAHRNDVVCASCKSKGLVAQACRGCGGPLRRIDQNGPRSPDRRGFCRQCRDESGPLRKVKP